MPNSARRPRPAYTPLVLALDGQGTLVDQLVRALRFEIRPWRV